MCLRVFRVLAQNLLQLHARLLELSLLEKQTPQVVPGADVFRIQAQGLAVLLLRFRGSAQLVVYQAQQVVALRRSGRQLDGVARGLFSFPEFSLLDQSRSAPERLLCGRLGRGLRGARCGGLLRCGKGVEAQERYQQDTNRPGGSLF